MTIDISLASKEDRASLRKFFKHYHINPIIKNRVDCYTSHNFTVVAKENGSIIGTVQWYVKEDPKAGVAEFEEVFISEECRGKGVGSELIKFAINEVIKFFKTNNLKPRKIFVFVGKRNLIARNLYEKFGFKPIAELNELFSDEEKEIFYCLNLKALLGLK
ncbi:MAG: GNAT family N-acetyltransferase [Candidatus Pacearchaeota archaeon]|nr:GNAT family N-acetyltransferase [Candidatus Pacearchaeota archaeon]